MRLHPSRLQPSGSFGKRWRNRRFHRGFCAPHMILIRQVGRIPLRLSQEQTEKRRSAIDRIRRLPPCEAVDLGQGWPRSWVGCVCVAGGNRKFASKNVTTPACRTGLRVVAVRASYPAEQAVGRGFSQRNRSSGANREPGSRGRAGDRHPGSAAWDWWPGGSDPARWVRGGL